MAVATPGAVKLASLKSDLAAESDGAWQLVPELPGVRLNVRSLSFGPYKAARSAMFARWQRDYGDDPVPDDVAAQGIGKLFGEHILLGWDGFDQPYDRDVALVELMDAAARKLRRIVESAADKVGVRQVEFVEVLKGN